MPLPTRFHTVPLAEVPASDTELTAPLVLIVDDEALIADTLALILARAGFQTLRAYSGTAALELATLVPPDLLISDICMPDMDGRDLASALLTLIPACKVLLISGNASAHYASTGDYLRPHFTTLAKPIPPLRLLQYVAALFDLDTPPAPAPSPWPFVASASASA